MRRKKMSLLTKIEDKLKASIIDAIIKSNLAESEQIPDITLEKPKEKEHGDFATNIAMQLTRIAEKSPRDIANDIVEQIDYKRASIEKVDIAGPGFINFFMKDDFLGEIVKTIIRED